jgi:hypothetical protein
MLINGKTFSTRKRQGQATNMEAAILGLAIFITGCVFGGLLVHWIVQ